MVEKLKKYLSGGSKNSNAGTEKQAFRRVVAMVIFGAIILVFVLFGFQGKHNAIGVGSAARVNSAYISVADLQSESQRMEQMYGQLFGGQMSGDAQRQFMRGQALENLIMNELISQSASDQGILVTNAEVRDFIAKDMPVFQQNGRFQRDIYVQVLENNHLTPADFEEKIRKEHRSMRLRHAFEVAAEPTALENAENNALKATKINVGFVKLDESQVTANMNISASEINTKLADPEFMKKVEAELAQNKSAYSSEEQVRASHILIKAKAGDAASEKAALEKITALKARASKEDFGKLAAANSEDTGSKVNKGDLGLFTRGKMVPEFDEAAFKQPVGVIGEPVKTSYGYHLIKVTEKKPAMVGTLENSKGKIAKTLIAKERFNQASTQLEEALKKSDAAGVDAALASLGVKWEETGLFDLGSEIAPKMGSRMATQAAFEVNAKSPWLNRLVRDGAVSYLIKFKELKTETPAAVVPTVVDNSTRERSNEMFSRWLESVKKVSTIEKNPLVLRE